MLEGRYGDVPLNIVLVIAGRDELDKNFWVMYESLLVNMSLESFTEEEAREFLARKGITADFTRAIELRPNDSWVIGLRGQVHWDMNHLSEALADFDHAITLDQTLINSLCNDRGMVLSELGRYAEAIESYEQGLEKNLNRYGLLYNIAVAMARWRGLSNAQTHIEMARSALLSAMDTSARGSALYGLSGLEALAGNIEQALNYLQQSIALEEEAIRSARHDIAWLDLRTDKSFQMLVSHPE